MGIKILTIFFWQNSIGSCRWNFSHIRIITEVELLDFTRKFIKKHMNKLFQRWASRFWRFFWQISIGICWWNFSHIRIITEVELLDFTRKFVKKHMDKLFQRWALRFWRFFLTKSNWQLSMKLQPHPHSVLPK